VGNFTAATFLYTSTHSFAFPVLSARRTCVVFVVDPFQSQPARDSHGFTLIELLVTVNIVALLAIVALPSFDSFLQRRQVEGLSAQLMADLQFLRTSAVARHGSLRLRVQSPSSGAGGCYVVHTGAADACRCEAEAAVCNAGAEALRVMALPSHSRMRISANVASMLVDPRLGTFSPTGSIEITSPQGDALRHVVSILGRVRICAAGGRWPGIAAC
jgi:type IV fimbrial biogenesis protein FimT